MLSLSPGVPRPSQWGLLMSLGSSRRGEGLSSGALLSTLPPAFDLAGGNFPVTHSAGTSCGHQGWGQGDPARRLGVLGSLREGGPGDSRRQAADHIWEIGFSCLSLGDGDSELGGLWGSFHPCLLIRALASGHTIAVCLPLFQPDPEPRRWSTVFFFWISIFFPFL